MPELLLSKRNYGKPIDMWAVGCIIAELYGRRPLFMGKHKVDQIHSIMKILGTPSTEVISRNGWGLNVVGKPQFKKHEFVKLYPFASTAATSLITKLVSWDPTSRPTVEGCLADPYLADVREAESEVNCNKLFDFSFENTHNSTYELKLLLHEEVERFNKLRRQSR